MTNQRVTVHPYTSDLGSMQDIQIGTAVLAYDCPLTYQTYILFFPQSLHIPGMERHLICPAQLRTNNVGINEVPLVHTPQNKRCRLTHSIWTNHPDPQLHIPLEMDGVTSFFNVRRPTRAEVNDDRNAIHVYMTSDTPWDPHSQQLGEEEAQLRTQFTDCPHQVRGHKLSRCNTTALDVDSHAD